MLGFPCQSSCHSCRIEATQLSAILLMDTQEMKGFQTTQLQFQMLAHPFNAIVELIKEAIYQEILKSQWDLHSSRIVNFRITKEQQKCCLWGHWISISFTGDFDHCSTGGPTINPEMKEKVARSQVICENARLWQTQPENYQKLNPTILWWSSVIVLTLFRHFTTFLFYKMFIFKELEISGRCRWRKLGSILKNIFRIFCYENNFTTAKLKTAISETSNVN